MKCNLSSGEPPDSGCSGSKSIKEVSLLPEIMNNTSNKMKRENNGNMQNNNIDMNKEKENATKKI